MEEIKIYNTKDLVLKVDKNINPNVLNFNGWETFISRLCEGRVYQEEAIKSAIIYLASGKYNEIEDLVKENYSKNLYLRKKYNSIENYLDNIQVNNKLYATIDLATGTGKSYVIYGIAQIMLGLGLVDKVLVLCPSLTIESGLMDKFQELSGSEKLKSAIPSDAIIKNPRIVNANVTIIHGDICVENIHAVYDRTDSSIEESFKGQGSRVLVLNDESHHIFNTKLEKDKDIKKWKGFLLNNEYAFKYILGFTGTAYIENDYFNDVIYRYSLRSAIEDKIIKNIEYTQKDDTDNDQERFQKIYANHLSNKNQYDKIKPLTILITNDIKNAKSLSRDLIEFLAEKEGIPTEEFENMDKVLTVTSDKAHRTNLFKLAAVDDPSCSYEWIVSVSMLTEGWDVKNVFQIVPWKDRAFNSKLLIAQVLGRGLRLPKEYTTPQPKVIVFNHDSWSKNIKKLVDEILEIETKLSIEVLNDGERSQYNYILSNLIYDKEEVSIDHERDREVFDYSRIKARGIALESQISTKEKSTTFESIFDNSRIDRTYTIEEKIYDIDSVLEKIYDEFSIRDWEGRILKLGENEYTKNNLPPLGELRSIIITSMKKVGIEGEYLVEKNRNRILQSFGTLLRRKGKTIVTKNIITQSETFNTTSMLPYHYSIGNLKVGGDTKLFYSTNFENELSEKNLDIVNKMIEENDGITDLFNLNEVNSYLLKTPLNLVVVNGNPEYKFINLLIKNHSMIDSWIKSRDVGFYGINYSWRKGDRYIQSKFNPDFFIKITRNNYTYFLVVEIKADQDNSDENKAKYKYGKTHFENLNTQLSQEGRLEQYIFHFLSPNGYSEYFEYLKKGTLLENQSKFRCELENLLEEIELE